MTGDWGNMGFIVGYEWDIWPLMIECVAARFKPYHLHPHLLPLGSKQIVLDASMTLDSNQLFIHRSCFSFIDRANPSKIDGSHL